MAIERILERIIPNEEVLQERPHFDLIIGEIATVQEVIAEAVEPTPRHSRNGIISFRTDDVAKHGYPGDFILPGLDNCSGLKH